MKTNKRSGFKGQTKDISDHVFECYMKATMQHNLINNAIQVFILCKFQDVSDIK